MNENELLKKDKIPVEIEDLEDYGCSAKCSDCWHIDEECMRDE